MGSGLVRPSGLARCTRRAPQRTASLTGVPVTATDPPISETKFSLVEVGEAVA